MLMGGCLVPPDISLGKRVSRAPFRRKPPRGVSGTRFKGGSRESFPSELPPDVPMVTAVFVVWTQKNSLCFRSRLMDRGTFFTTRKQGSKNRKTQIRVSGRVD